MSLQRLFSPGRRQVLRVFLLFCVCLVGIRWAASDPDPDPVRLSVTAASSQIEIEFDAPDAGFYYPEYRLLDLEGFLT